ncbi:hypothetical protein C8Q78DRAFT_1053356 [Trametes maxima]|nr:hypothetical protein C8Q78DRAFT_1053356 [Trametes maxima]
MHNVVLGLLYHLPLLARSWVVLVAGMLSDVLGKLPASVVADIVFIGGVIGQTICHIVWSTVHPELLFCPPAHDFNLITTEMNR